MNRLTQNINYVIHNNKINFCDFNNGHFCSQDKMTVILIHYYIYFYYILLIIILRQIDW